MSPIGVWRWRQDTIVRFSAAKYLARISDKLPKEMAGEVAAALLDMFEGGFDELDSAERVLQGCCFAFAELARRGGVQEELVERLIACALKVSPVSLRPHIDSSKTDAG